MVSRTVWRLLLAATASAAAAGGNTGLLRKQRFLSRRHRCRRPVTDRITRRLGLWRLASASSERGGGGGCATGRCQWREWTPTLVAVGFARGRHRERKQQRCARHRCTAAWCTTTRTHCCFASTHTSVLLSTAVVSASSPLTAGTTLFTTISTDNAATIATISDANIRCGKVLDTQYTAIFNDGVSNAHQHRSRRIITTHGAGSVAHSLHSVNAITASGDRLCLHRLCIVGRHTQRRCCIRRQHRWCGTCMRGVALLAPTPSRPRSDSRRRRDDGKRGVADGDGGRHSQQRCPAPGLCCRAVEHRPPRRRIHTHGGVHHNSTGCHPAGTWQEVRAASRRRRRIGARRSVRQRW